MALAVLSGSTVGDTRTAIASGDVKRFQVVPGIGKKTAERVIVELRERIAGELASAPSSGSADVSARALAREGLVGLGYDPSEAERMLDAAERAAGSDAEAEELIAAALRTAAKAA
jgi:Holliday junction DNA helicase RuvA